MPLAAGTLAALTPIDPATLRAQLADGAEIAVLDVREVGVHTTAGHILLSTPLPFSQIEMKVAALVPHKDPLTFVRAIAEIVPRARV